MTPEAGAAWLAECAAADKALRSQPLVLEEIDKFCFPKGVLERRELDRKRMAENPIMHEERKQACKDYRKDNTEKCKEGQRDWYQRNKKYAMEKQKAARNAKKTARLVEQSSGAVENELSK